VNLTKLDKRKKPLVEEVLRRLCAVYTPKSAVAQRTAKTLWSISYQALEDIYLLVITSTPKRPDPPKGANHES